MNDIEQVADVLGRVVFNEVATSALCRDLSVAQVHALCRQVAGSSLHTLRQALVATAQGTLGTAEVGGESVVAPLAGEGEADHD